ncbi:MAG: bifunctional adenosylcobinamide kinase/adenosylcobinamide-phosphate guanylyltransferase [Mycobacterium sp.]|nr:bifunctional adenosylcobinamide kinase/adenosylcobinamide-phosphate guanylyltransferase [Mycobacterium sp.]
MRTLVLGGIRSGKSRWAETAITEGFEVSTPVRYLATGSASPDDRDWQRRIAAHRRRRPDGWRTVESADVAAELRTDPDIPTLVDDLGGWLTAILDGRGWDGGSAEPDVEDLASAVDAFRAPLALVSPEVGLTVVSPTAAGRRFTDELGALNQRMADACDRVVLVVAGQPLWVKPAAAAGARP